MVAFATAGNKIRIDQNKMMRGNAALPFVQCDKPMQVS